MKKILLAILSFFTIASFAQQTIEITTVKDAMSKGPQPGYATDIPQASLEEVKKDWMKLIQEDTKVKAAEEGHEIVIYGAVNKEVSPDPFNIYSLLLNKDSLVHLVVFFEIDSGSFFDPATNEDDLVSSKIDLSIRDFMKDFAVGQYRIAVEDELDSEEQMLKDLNKELKDLKDEQEKYEKSIKSGEQKIASAEEELSMLNTQSASKLEEVESARLNLSGITDKEAKKAVNKQLSTLEKEKKKLDSEKEKQQKNIVGYQTDIKEYEQAIEKLVEAQEELEVKIETQENRVSAIEARLRNIK